MIQGPQLGRGLLRLTQDKPPRQLNQLPKSLDLARHRIETLTIHSAASRLAISRTTVSDTLRVSRRKCITWMDFLN